jgi:hypothetical protein
LPLQRRVRAAPAAGVRAAGAAGVLRYASPRAAKAACTAF